MFFIASHQSRVQLSGFFSKFEVGFVVLRIYISVDYISLVVSAHYVLCEEDAVLVEFGHDRKITAACAHPEESVTLSQLIEEREDR